MNDDTPTTEQPDESGRPDDQTPTQAQEPAARPRRLRRSSSDRVLLGVAGGLGRYFGVDPVMFRIGFVVSVFFGGLGALAYLLLAIFAPTDGDPDRAQRFGMRLRGMGFWRALAMVGIVLLALSALAALASGAAFVVGLGWGVPVAIAIIAIGAVLVLSAFRGGGLAKWLIPPVIAIAVGAGTASAADLDFRGGIGERQHHPLSVGAIPADGYRLGIGHLVVDLRDLDWNKARVVHLDVSLGAGQADVLVPAHVCVAGTAHVGVGESVVTGERNDGIDVDHRAAAGTSAVPRVELDATVDTGQLRVINSDTADVDDAGQPYFVEDAPQRAAERRACATG
jgi:phage shock protein PspC (stress-responsive transcriptional regulator)